jgi:hypothetical protein
MEALLALLQSLEEPELMMTRLGLIRQPQALSCMEALLALLQSLEEPVLMMTHLGLIRQQRSQGTMSRMVLLPRDPALDVVLSPQGEHLAPQRTRKPRLIPLRGLWRTKAPQNQLLTHLMRFEVCYFPRLCLLLGVNGARS